MARIVVNHASYTPLARRLCERRQCGSYSIEFVLFLQQLFQGYFKALSRLYQGSIKALSRLYKDSIRLYKDSIKALLKLYKGSIQAVLRLY